MAKFNVNVSSLVIGFLLGLSLMLLAGAVRAYEPRYQIFATSTDCGGPTCWVLDTYSADVCRFIDDKWHQWERLPDQPRRRKSH